ncbi:hypothetical protein G6F42_015327 [Rhizopus arrhizus]|nr:hypothetical protein G6F42_015327 [Rhizopus arrhizus]
MKPSKSLLEAMVLGNWKYRYSQTSLKISQLTASPSLQLTSYREIARADAQQLRKKIIQLSELYSATHRDVVPELYESNNTHMYTVGDHVYSVGAKCTLPNSTSTTATMGEADEDSSVGECERILINVKTTARKELVLLHSERRCESGEIGLLLTVARRTVRGFKCTIMSRCSLVAMHLKGATWTKAMENISSIGIERSWHIGFILALQEGIPIDITGGTSVGSLTRGYYTKNIDLFETTAKAKAYEKRASRWWRRLLDLKYPVVARHTGYSVDGPIWKCIGDSHIEDFWLLIFAVTPTITYSYMETRTSGYTWRYIRDFMSLSG